MSASQPNNRSHVCERPNLRDSPVAGPSGIGRIQTRNSLRRKKQSMVPTIVGYIDLTADEDRLLNCDCIVCQLIKSPFFSRDKTDQSKILSNGRPKPPLKLVFHNKVQDPEHFYQFCEWICGCNTSKRMFCWPCILFSTNFNGWDLFSIKNIDDLKKLKVEHEFTPRHLSCLIDFKRFKIDSVPSFINRDQVESYNQIVTKNRIIITRFIEIICYLTQQKLPLFTERVAYGSDNFSELLYLVKHFDPVFNLLMEGSEILSNLTPEFLTGLLESITDAVLEFAKKEIANANYFSLMLEEIKSTPGMIKLASVLRYADMHGLVQERFIGFFELPKDEMIIHHVNALLDKYNCGKRLVGISYIGPSFFDMKNKFLLDQIKLGNKEVTFVHSYSQNSLYTISTFINYNPESSLYFSYLWDISWVFSKSSDLRFKLQEMINEEVSWDYDSNLVHKIIRYRNEIPKVLDTIEEIEVWRGEIIYKAKGIKNYMCTFDFIVLSFFYVEIFSIDVPIFALSINDEYNVDEYMKNIDRFVESMDDLTNRFPIIWANIMNDLGLLGIQSSFGSLKTRFESIFICLQNTIIFKVKDLKYTDVKLLRFISLLEPKRFAEFSQNFPVELIQEIKDTRFMNMFNIRKLRSELYVLYYNKSLQVGNIYEFYIYLKSSGMSHILTETYKLAEFIVALPLGPAIQQDLYSASNRIKLYFEDPVPQCLSTKGAILTIEKEFIKNLKKDADFEDHIINDFSRKAGQIELSYIPT